MTNYKRFISYLYHYEIGQKKGNVGFARVESSDELCKVTVHCVLKNIPKKVCKVYLLRRQTSLIISEEVGTGELKDDLLDVKLSFERGTIVPNDFDFKDCVGVVLMYSKDNYIGAKWDESSITYHEACLIEQTSKTEKNKVSSVKVIEEPKKSKVQEQQDFNHTKDAIQESKSTIYVVPSEEIKVIDLETRQREIKEKNEKRQEAIWQEKREQESENSNWNQGEIQIEPESMNETNERKSEDIIPKEEKVEEEIKEEAKAKEEELVSAAGGSAAAAVNMNQWIDHPAARAILNRFVRMYPFDDGEMAECVRLEPKDIGLLPMTSWPLGNNSFVLHSYCNFRHLLFTKKLTREGCEYYLMVPGALNVRERQLAKMFGFENFKCSRRRCMRDGEFGYWYIEINFN